MRPSPRAAGAAAGCPGCCSPSASAPSWCRPAGLLALPLLLAARTRRGELALTAAAASVAVYLPVLLRSPREVVGNLLLFNLSRPGDRTGLLDGLSPERQQLVKALVAALVVLALAVLARQVRRAVDPGAVQGDVACTAAVVVALLYAASPVIHRNWLFWIVPFLAVGLAVKSWGREQPAGAHGTRLPAPLVTGPSH